jgi:hypothetical protein
LILVSVIIFIFYLSLIVQYAGVKFHCCVGVQSEDDIKLKYVRSKQTVYEHVQCLVRSPVTLYDSKRDYYWGTGLVKHSAEISSRYSRSATSAQNSGELHYRALRSTSLPENLEATPEEEVDADKNGQILQKTWKKLSSR